MDSQTDRDIQIQPDTYRDIQRHTESYRDRQSQTETYRDRPRQTDRHTCIDIDAHMDNLYYQGQRCIQTE